MALATSKRKFYKLLDNLSKSNVAAQSSDSLHENPSQTSINLTEAEINSQQLAADRPAKRSRMPISQLSTSSPRPALTPVRRPGTAASGAPRTSVRIISSNFESRSSQSTSSNPQHATQTNTPTKTSPSNVKRSSAPSVYAPWNQEHFLARLKTFADVKVWGPKPKTIDEVAWAKRGWCNVGREEVGCSSCGKRLVIKLESNSKQYQTEQGAKPYDGNTTDGDHKWWIEEAEKKLVEKYESLIVEGHSEGCLWRRGGCKDDIYRIKFSDVTVWQNELWERYSSLQTMSKELPTNIVTPEFHRSGDVDITIEEISKWFKSAITESKAEKDKANCNKELGSINTTALILALCGWGGEKTAGVQFAYCQKCFSRVGFWLYRLPSSDEDDGMKLDPIALHRSHCPWQNGESQHALGDYSGLAGWQVLTEVISVRLSRTEKSKHAHTNGAVEDDGTESGSIGYRPSTSMSTMSKTREEVDMEDKTRESKLARLKKAFTVKKAKSKASLKSNVTSSNV